VAQVPDDPALTCLIDPVWIEIQVAFDLVDEDYLPVHHVRLIEISVDASGPGVFLERGLLDLSG
jgi:hypothetical protein